MNSRPVQKLDLLLVTVEILGKHCLDLVRLQHLVHGMAQLNDTTVFVGEPRLGGAQQEACVVLRAHGLNIRQRCAGVP